jgi:superfamily I DNA/RNA helicase
MNFRSTPKLVTLQNYLAKELLNKAEFAIPSSKWKHNQGEALLWTFQNPEQEMKVVQEAIVKWMKEDKIVCRDICILIKSSLPVYAGQIIDYLNSKNILARDEGEYQEFLTEEIIIFLTSFIHVLYDRDLTGYFESVLNFLFNLNFGFEDHQLLQLHLEFSKFINGLRKKFGTHFGGDSIFNLVKDIGKFAGVNKIRNIYPQYKNGSYLNELVIKFINLLKKQYEISLDIIKAIEIIEGKNSIPVMTIHKSKGLEYHSVIFIGLEDAAFWSFNSQADEDKNAFFVALSRAKERVLFTFSRTRINKFGKSEINTTTTIRIIVDKLQSSGIVEVVEYNK